MMENKNNPLPAEHDIEYAANLVSGEYTTVLVNELASYIDDDADLKSILDMVKTLFLSEDYASAMTLIKSFYLILAYDYPDEIDSFNANDELRRAYLMEFIADYEDILLDFEAEEI